MVKKCAGIMYALMCVILMTASAFSEEPDRLITVFQDKEHMFTGIALSQGGRMFLAYPNWLDEHSNSVVEVLADGKVAAYPDERWNSWKSGEPGKDKFVCAQALYVDSNDCLWVVDAASVKMEGVLEGACKLVKINLKDNRVEHVFPLDSALAGKESYINDVQVDGKLEFAYLTDSSVGALIVLNLKNGKTMRLLQKHSSTTADSGFVFRVNGRELTRGKDVVKIHSDGLALTPDGKYLYYKPLTDNRLYRIETKYLRDYKPAPAPEPAKGKKKKKKKGPEYVPLEDRVEKLGVICTTDGMICDRKGNVYLGDVIHKEIVCYFSDGRTEILMKDDRLMWPDSYAISKDGYLYVTCSQIDSLPFFNEGKSLRTTPYTVYKFKLAEDAVTPPKKKK